MDNAGISFQAKTEILLAKPGHFVLQKLGTVCMLLGSGVELALKLGFGFFFTFVTNIIERLLKS